MESVFKYANKRKGFVTFLILFVVPFIKVLLHYFISPFCVPSGRIKRLSFELTGTPLERCLDFGEHFGLLFEEQLILFVPSVILVILVVWNFSNTIDDLLAINKREENKIKNWSVCLKISLLFLFWLLGRGFQPL